MNLYVYGSVNSTFGKRTYYQWRQSNPPRLISLRLYAILLLLLDHPSFLLYLSCLLLVLMLAACLLKVI